MHLIFHWSTIFNSQDMEADWMSIDRWMNKEDEVNIYNGILLSHKKKEIVASAATWIDLEMLY